MMTSDDDMQEVVPVASSASCVDDDMEDDKGPLVCMMKSEDAVTTKPVSRKKSATLTPQQLYAKIEESRDKLFFINYSLDDGSGGSKTEKPKEQWYLVRVDLDTCEDVEESQDCENSGKYYVEFYTKALKDKSKPDNLSKWWLIWNAFRWTNGEMIIGVSREFEPNNKAAIKRRLVELSKNNSTDEEVEIPHFHPNLDRFTTYSDIVDLTDPKIRLVGPFDFEAVQSKDVAADIKLELGNISPDLVFIRDRVPISHWMELLKAIKGSNMPLPTIEDSKAKKKRRQSNIGRRKSVKIQPACHLCGRVDSTKELLVFDGSLSHSSLCAHKECGLKSLSANERMLISTKEVSELVEKTLKSVRQSTTSDGTAFCVLDELRSQLDLHLNQAARNGVVTPEYPAVYPCSEFADGELRNMPELYAYYTKADDPDGVSERNAKIAKLDRDVEKRREKRLAREYAGESKKNYNATATKSRSGNNTEGTMQSVRSSEKNSLQPIQPDVIDPLGLAEVNVKIGVLSRIQAERIREKRRASSGTMPPKKKAKTSTEDVSEQNEKVCTTIESTGKGMSTQKAAKIPKQKSSSTSAMVYIGPHLSIPAEPAAPFLGIPNLPDGWICRNVPRANNTPVSFLCSECGT